MQYDRQFQRGVSGESERVSRSALDDDHHLITIVVIIVRDLMCIIFMMLMTRHPSRSAHSPRTRRSSRSSSSSHHIIIMNVSDSSLVHPSTLPTGSSTESLNPTASWRRTACPKTSRPTREISPRNYPKPSSTVYNRPSSNFRTASTGATQTRRRRHPP